MIDARAESFHEKLAFLHAFRKRRCIIPADGFYEWKREKGLKYPYYIYNKDHSPLSLAGIWESWKDPEDGKAKNPDEGSKSSQAV